MLIGPGAVNQNALLLKLYGFSDIRGEREAESAKQHG